MKKIGIALILISIFNASCTKTSNLEITPLQKEKLQESNLASPSIIQSSALINNQLIELRDNPLFIECVKVSANISGILYKETQLANTNLEQIKNEIERLQSENPQLSGEQQIIRINEILNLSDKSLFTESYYKLRLNWLALKATYGAILTSEYIVQETKAVYAKYAPLGLGVLGGDEGPCKSLGGYTACSIVAASTAQLAFAGCLGTIFGAPACFAIVLIGQTAAIGVCYYTWCK